MVDSSVVGRRAFGRSAWSEAFAELSDADRASPLGPDDLERLAVSAYLVGEDRESAAAWARAHQECMQRGDLPRAARNAFWLAFGMLLRGEMAPANGWMARVRRTLEEHGAPCVEQGLALVPEALGRLLGGDSAAALAGFSDALSIGTHFGDVDLVTLGRLGRGQALILGGQEAEGVGELDDAMVGVTAGQVSPLVAGLVYCAVIDECQALLDLRRAAEWTAALSSWCESQPDLVPYRGQCLVHRAEILQFRGEWPDATLEAERAYEHLSRPPPHPAVGDALYRLAELRRLRGDLLQAEDAYRGASECGRDPQPGLARLRLAQGRIGEAETSLRRAVGEPGDRAGRAQLLATYVEVLLAAQHLDAARVAADELQAMAERVDVPVLDALSAHVTGLVLLAIGDGLGAAAVLRRAGVAWRELGSPYEAARVRVAIGLACRRQGDEDGAILELDAAERAFRQLGAATDLASMAQPSVSPAHDPAERLSTRERQVLKLLATGTTNRAIADQLGISEKTVARHVANMFTKLDLTSRSGATAFAYEHGLVRPTYTR